jgi:MoxR-like ATPase
MARVKGCEAVYEVADQWRTRCLADTKSLLWPEEETWTIENLERGREVMDVLVKRRTTTGGHMEIEFASESEAVRRVIADATTVWNICPASITPENRLGFCHYAASWVGKPGDFDTVSEAISANVGAQEASFFLPGFQLQRGAHLRFILEFARRLKIDEIDPENRLEVAELTAAVLQDIKRGHSARNMILHLLFPDHYEAVFNNWAKDKIVHAPAFQQYIGNQADDWDDRLAAIRAGLTEKLQRNLLSFYDDDVLELWRPGNVEPSDDELEANESNELTPQYWWVNQGQSYAVEREGDYLWAGKYDRRGLTIPHHETMLALEIGDCVLHYANGAIRALGVVTAKAAETSRPTIRQPEAGTSDGYLAAIRYFELAEPIKLSEIPDDLRLSGEAPFTQQGSVKQGYLYPLSAEWAYKFYQLFNQQWPNAAHLIPMSPDGTKSNEIDEVTRITLDDLARQTHLGVAELQELEELIRAKRQLIFEGPPGSGKTYVADLVARYLTGNSLDPKVDHNEQIEIVQFHQSYDYEDFVQGIRPRTDPDTKQIRYDVVDGIFLEMCQRAAADPDRTYVLIIDEINRGNVSRIFGELLMLLEYRGKRVRLPYGSSDGSEAQRYLRIPDNLILIGTMNSTDRSLAMIDYALRRRFFFYRMLPVVHGRAPVFERWLATQETLSPGDHRRLLERFIALNQEVSKEHSPDFQIGHSYFMQDEIGTETALRRIWTWSLRPLLQEYFHGSRETETLLAQFEQLVLGPPRHEATDDELSVGVEAMDGAQTARPESPDDV